MLDHPNAPAPIASSNREEIFCVSSTVGATETGADAATASRYAYFGALLMLPSLALVLDAARERLQVRAAESWLTVTVVLGLLVVPGVFGVIDFR